MGDDDGHHHHHLQTVPSCAMNSAKGHDMGTAPSMKRCVSSPEVKRQSISIINPGNIPSSMRRPVQKDISTNDRAWKPESSIGMAEVPDEQNGSDQSYPSTPRDRSCTPDSTSLNDGRGKKSSCEIIDRKAVYFPHKDVVWTIDCYLYRINISGDHDLGFIVPCELPKLPRFYLYENSDSLQVQLMFLRKIDFQECKDHLERFCRYIFEEVSDYINTKSNSSLQFDLEKSPFKLLPCFLTESGELDYPRMASICNRKNELPVELSDQELYIRSGPPDSQIYVTLTDALLPSQASDPQRKAREIAVKRFHKPSIDYLKKSSSSANKKQKTQSSKPETCQIKVLRYASINQMDLKLIYKLPSALARITLLYHIEQLRRLLADYISPNSSLVDVDQMPVVAFSECLLEIHSSHQASVVPFDSLNYQLLSAYNDKLELPHDLIFQAITKSSAAENTNMDAIEKLGDSSLESFVSTALYHRYPSDTNGQLTEKRSREVANSNLCRISIEERLKDYLNTTKITFNGSTANWLPPGYTVDDENSDRYLKQKVQQKASADMIEALIGAVLVSTGCLTTIKFMNGLGLNVIPIDENNNIIQTPSVLRMKETSSINEIESAIEKEYRERSFTDIETKIKHIFTNKAYLIAAFTHSSCSASAKTINYERLKFVGNSLLKFLITRYICMTVKSITSSDISDARDDVINNHCKNIMLVNDLHKKMICSAPDLMNSILSSTVNLKIPQAVAHVFDALIGAIFFDSNFSSKVVWDVIERLLRKQINLDSVIQNPKLHPVRYINKNGGKIIGEHFDENDNFGCYVKSRDGTEVKGSGKSKTLAQQSACNQLKGLK